jgi:protein-disulfide isomerase
MSQHTLQKVAVLLSLISVVAVVLGIKLVTNKMDSIAAMQFGWAKNYALAQKLFTSDKFAQQQEQQLQSAIDQMNGAPAAAPTANTPKPTTETFPGGKLTADQLVAVKKDVYVEGDRKAKITVIEYSDLECPFCIRQFNDKTVENAVAAFPGQVNHVFKVVQGVNHPNTEYKSLAVLCAADQKGTEGYVGLYKAILGESTPQVAVAKEKVLDLAKGIWLDSAKLASCITNGDAKSTYAANWAEFQTFTSSPGTPGNIILNNETGEWKLIAGAYPVDTFKQIIAELSK